MKEVPNFKDILSSEEREREQYRVMLEELSGFTQLSEEQKRYLLASLYIQQRAERGTDPMSASRIQEMPEKFKPNAPEGVYIAHSETLKDTPRDSETKASYEKSQKKVMLDYCHAAIIELEGYRTREKKPEEWHDAGPILSYADLEDLVNISEEKWEFPFVIEIWDGAPNNTDMSQRVHSTVLLGRNNEGTMMVWEKAGYHMPYQTLGLSHVYEVYGKFSGWRLRPLSV